MHVKTILKFFVLLLLIGVVAYAGQRLWAQHTTLTNLRTAELGQAVGPADADKVIVEFLDYRCNFCRNIHPVMKAFHNKNPDVRIVYRHYPIFGIKSIIEADVALAAALQGEFEAVHNRLMENDTPVEDATIDALIAEFGLNREQFLSDMKGPVVGSTLLFNLDAAEFLKINATPTFLIGDIIYVPQDGIPTVKDIENLVYQAYGE